MSKVVKIPDRQYYAVIFTSVRTDGDDGYKRMADEMVELVSKQPGFLGAESVRDANGFGITVSYWESLDAIRQWKENPSHQIAQKMGKEIWYKQFAVRICKVERDNISNKDDS